MTVDIATAGVTDSGVRWLAHAIAPDRPENLEGGQPPVLFRREFVVGGGAVSARLLASAHGIYVAFVNGARVGEDLLTPGWSAYRTRLRYQEYDVTEQVTAGPNAIGIAVADGWYRGFLFGERRNWYGPEVAAFAQLEVTYEDGRVEVVATDTSWRVGEGPWRSADLYMGATYDARLEDEVEGWTRPGFDDSAWGGCVAVERAHATLVPQTSPPVRRTEVVRPVSVSQSPSGAVIADFGQNLVGRLRLRDLDVPAGGEVVVRHAEVLEDGELCTAPLRAARQTDRFVSAGRAVHAWEPEFTFHGFRYAEIRGWEGVQAHNLEAHVCHSDMRRTGWFSCSHPLVNRLHDNAVWSMRGNFVDVPTDCPQRDERLGWTGDIQVFSPAAAFLYDSSAFLDSWLADLAADQYADGGVPFVIPMPSPVPFGSGTAAAWGDAAVVVPWVAYQRFGDRALLERQYPSMAAYVDACVAAHGPELNAELFQFGDWLDPTAPANKASEGLTAPLLIAGAYLVHSLDLTAATARLLGREEDAVRHGEAAARYRARWRALFRAADGRLSSDSPTAYSLALCFELLDGRDEVADAGRRLRALVEANGHHIATGFVGTPIICDALTMTGHVDTAYRLLLQTECPSWLYPVTHGATTIWERWDSLRPDGRVNSDEMTSFNHYALGAVVDWLHRHVGGLAPLEPGYRAALVRPRPGGGLTSASVRHDARHGTFAVGWTLDGDHFDCTVTVPPLSTALTVLPIAGWQPQELGEGTHRFGGTLAQTAPSPGLPVVGPHGPALRPDAPHA